MVVGYERTVVLDPTIDNVDELQAVLPGRCLEGAESFIRVSVTCDIQRGATPGGIEVTARGDDGVGCQKFARQDAASIVFGLWSTSETRSQKWERRLGIHTRAQSMRRIGFRASANREKA